MEEDAVSVEGPPAYHAGQRIADGGSTGLWEFWRAELGGCEPLSLFPAGQRMDNGDDGVQAFFASPGLTALLREYAGQEGTALRTVLLAIFQALIYRYTGARDFLVAVPAAAKAAPGSAGDAASPGLLPLRSRVSGESTFASQVARTGQSLDRALSHQGLPFHLLAGRPGHAAGSGGHAHPQLLFSFIPREEAGGAGAASSAAVPGGGAELAMTITDLGDRLRGVVSLGGSHAGTGMAMRLADHYLSLAGIFSARPETTLAAPEFLSQSESDLIAALNNTSSEYPRDRSLADLFGEQAARAPDAPALSFGRLRLSYAQLDRATDSLAARLRELGVGLGTIVAVYGDRDACVVTGMLAAIKAGAAYLPLEPTHPPARLLQIVAEASPRLVLAGPADREAAALGIPVLAVTEHLSSAARAGTRSGPRPEGRPGPDDLAYVMYTSGSAGSPKGICVTHRNIIRLVRDTNYVEFRPGDRVAQISNAAFDAATFEVWGALLNGAHLIGFDRDTVLSPGRLAAAIRESRVQTMVVATPLFNQLAADDPGTFANVSQLLVGGDVIGAKQASSVAALPGCALTNGYGPTETTTFAATHRVTAGSARDQSVPIGRPIANTTCYVLDDMLRPRPVGLAGQLYIGGDGVARGYLARPGLTAERFIPDPFAREPGARMYATGDLVRLLPGGTLEFLGRADFQVKVRGFRIELAEVDAVMLAHPRITEAVTVVTGERAEEKSLVSYYVTASKDVPQAGEILAFMSERLPAYMVPSRLVWLPALPRNANSKIDRGKLPDPGDAATPLTGAPAPTEGTVDHEIAAMIGAMLKVPAFGQDENFFDSGGHSLLAARLLGQLRKRYQVDMALSDLFDAPTARGIAGYIRRHGAGGVRDRAGVTGGGQEPGAVPASSAAPGQP
jgi:amino acid adenylation domain-containing protein